LLIGSGEGEILPAIAACELHVSGHMTPCHGLYSAKRYFFARILFDPLKITFIRGNSGRQTGLPGPLKAFYPPAV
jgi:hypothetical protein